MSSPWAFDGRNDYTDQGRGQGAGRRGDGGVCMSKVMKQRFLDLSGDVEIEKR